MTLLKGENIRLRALEPEDIEFLFGIENDISNWEISNTKTPFSRDILNKYLLNAHQDIYTAKQYRFVICQSDLNPIGTIDLFDFDPFHKRVGLGILILAKYQNLGFGFEAIKLICDYVFKVLQLNQVYVNITTENKKSIQLFEKFGFELAGIKKDWIQTMNGFKDEALYQLINQNNET